MVTIDTLTPVAERVLEALSIYRYLTPEQMMRLGVTRDKRHLYTVLSGLLAINPKNKKERKPKEIGELDYGVRVGRGRLPRLYFLTKRGAELLESMRKDLEDVPYVQRARKAANDYQHKVHTVDCHIAARALADRDGHRVRFFKTYFEFAKQNESVTRIPLRRGALIPDALCLLDCADGKERLFALEVANGMNTGKVEDQIARYCEALGEDAIETACGASNAVRVLFVFEHERALELIQARVAKDPRVQSLGPYFFCKPLSELLSGSFGDDWRRLDQNAALIPLFGS